MPISQSRAERHRRKRKGKRARRIWQRIYEEPLVDIETFVASPQHLNADPLFPRQASVLKEFFDESKGYTELVLKYGKSMV